MVRDRPFASPIDLIPEFVRSRHGSMMRSWRRSSFSTSSAGAERGPVRALARRPEDVQGHHSSGRNRRVAGSPAEMSAPARGAVCDPNARFVDSLDSLVRRTGKGGDTYRARFDPASIPHDIENRGAATRIVQVPNLHLSVPARPPEGDEPPDAPVHPSPRLVMSIHDRQPGEWPRKGATSPPGERHSPYLILGDRR
jgi:hypothetical protein